MSIWIISYLLIGVLVSILILRTFNFNLRVDKPLIDLSSLLYPEGKPLGMRINEWLMEWLLPVLIFLTMAIFWPIFLAGALYGYLKRKYS